MKEPKKRFIKKLSLLDRAIERLKERHNEKNFNRLVDEEYNTNRDLLNNGIAYLGTQIQNDPDKYDNNSRNMNHFVFEKMQQEAANRTDKDDSVDYFEY